MDLVPRGGGEGEGGVEIQSCVAFRWIAMDCTFRFQQSTGSQAWKDCEFDDLVDGLWQERVVLYILRS